MTYDLGTVALRKRQEAELEVAEVEMLRFSLGWIESEMSTSEGQRMLDVLERKSERPDCDGLDMYRGGIVNILVEGRWNCQEGGLQEDQR